MPATFEQTAALSADVIESQQGGGRDMQPLRLAADAKPGLIHVLHQCASDEIARVEHPRDTLPYPFMPSPTSAHSSFSIYCGLISEHSAEMRLASSASLGAGFKVSARSSTALH